MGEPSSAEDGGLPDVVLAAVQGASEMSAERIVVLEVGDVLSYYRLVHHRQCAEFKRRVRRIAELITEHVKAAGGDGPHPYRRPRRPSMGPA